MSTPIYEPVLGLDDFKKPKVLTGWEGVAITVLMVLFGKPGCYPSIPELGLNIQKYRHNKMSDVEPDELKAQILYQCAEIKDLLIDNNFTVEKVQSGEGAAILIQIPVEVSGNVNRLVIGIRGSDDGVIYNYELFDANN